MPQEQIMTKKHGNVTRKQKRENEMRNTKTNQHLNKEIGRLISFSNPAVSVPVPHLGEDWITRMG